MWEKLTAIYLTCVNDRNYNLSQITEPQHVACMKEVSVSCLLCLNFCFSVTQWGCNSKIKDFHSHMQVCLFVCLLCVQDVDSAYLVKADLEDKVGALTDEINFLRNVYEEVMKCLHALNHRGAENSFYDLLKQSSSCMSLFAHLIHFPHLVSSYFLVKLLKSDWPSVHCCRWRDSVESRLQTSAASGRFFISANGNHFLVVVVVVYCQASLKPSVLQKNLKITLKHCSCYPLKS